MNILNIIKSQLIEVIEWTDDSRDTLSYRWPDEDKEIKNGAQLIVRESQQVQFVAAGQYADLFGPGKHTLSTENIPVLSTIYGWKYGFQSPFKCDVYYINTRLFTGNKWGTANPVTVRDPDFGVVRIRAFGTYDFRIVQPALFLKEVAGTDQNFRLDEFADTMRSRIVSIFSEALAKAKIPVLDVATRYSDLGEALVQVINPAVVDKYGLETVFSAIEDWMDYSERMLRNAIAKVPDGTYYAEGWLDNDGINLDKPLKVCTTTTIHGDSLTIDLTGSADEVYTAFNCSFEGTTRTAINYIMHALFLDDDIYKQYIPQNDGMRRPVEIIAPKGCIFNPNFPRATFSRFNQANLLADCVMRSLADVMPDRVSAGTSAHIHFVSYNGFNKEKGEFWVYLEVDEGSYGGRCGKDAIDSCDALVANTRNDPIEEIEWHYPLRVERYELNPEKVAPGKWRGGLGIIRETRFLQEGTVTCEGDRHMEAPKGIFGGAKGHSASMTKNPGTNHAVSLQAKLSDEEFGEGDVLQIRTPCGGGYGNPKERDPKLVLSDVLDDFTDIDDARESYGVVINPETMTVDEEATQKLRASH